MGLTPQITNVGLGTVVFQDIDDTAQGGFSLDATNLTAGATVPAGQPMYFDESARTCKPMKVAELYANATNTATVYQVKKGHLFVVGDYFASVVGGAAYVISSIDTSNANYDAITVGTTLGVAYTAGQVFFKSSATGASAAAYHVTPKGLLKNDVTVATDAPCTVVLDGIVYERRAPKVGTVIGAYMPNIIYSQSF